MTPYRQPVWPGDVGTDVLAYKRAARVMGVKGAGGLIVAGTGKKRAGASFVAVIKLVQRQHGLTVDGKIGAKTHAVIAPHFDRWGVTLYRSQPIRKRTPPAPPPTSAQQAARQLLAYAAEGKYHADNPGDLRDLSATANGKAVWSQGGYWVHVDRRPLELLLWLIGRGYRVGTFAICSDHHWDGPHGHAGGFAVDISSLNGHSIASGGNHDLVLEVARAIRDHTEAHLRPWQQICGGSGYVFYTDIEACCIPSAGFYGWTTVGEHRNHIHDGYYPTAGVVDRRPAERSLAVTLAHRLIGRSH